MLILALDTSTRQASIALISEEQLYAEYSWHVGNNHSVELLERIKRLVSDCNLTLSALDGIAVAAGPGSFNGVRVAMATAKSLAFALNKPLVGISTLDIVAAQQRQWRGPICAGIEAGRSELYSACYSFVQAGPAGGDLVSRMRQLSEYRLIALPELIEMVNQQAPIWIGATPERQPLLFCGELNSTSRAAISTQLKEKVYFIPASEANRQASVLAMLALPRFQAGLVDDPVKLEPRYLRRPSITTSTRKQPLLGKTPDRSTGQNNSEREDGALRH